MHDGHGSRSITIIVLLALLLSLLVSSVYTDSIFHEDIIHEETFQHNTHAPIPLVQPDPSNTKLIVNERGIKFLQSLQGTNIIIVAVAGRAKTGKSYLMNHLFGMSQITSLMDCSDDHCGFPVGVTFFPGTKVHAQSAHSQSAFSTKIKSLF